MYLIYGVSLILLIFILLLLWKEEKRFKNSITHGLASKFWILRERRRFVRLNEEIRIRYNLLNKSFDFRSTKTVNISKRGLCLLTYERLKDRSYLGLELDLPDFSKPVKLIGQVAWTKDLKTQDAQGRRLFYAGLKFIKINPESEAILLAHLSNLKPV